MSYGNSVYGQISTGEQPISFSTDIPILRGDERTLKTLPLLDMKKIEQEDKEEEANGIPPRFGYRHEVNYNLENSGEWVELSNGDKIWRLYIHCPEALSINLLYDKFWMPDGTKFFIYSNDRRHSIGAFTSVNNKGNKNNIQGFATGLVYGDGVTLEYYVPNNVREIGVISIVYVVHGYRYIVLPESMQSRWYGDAGNCQVNVNCSEGQDWQKEKNAVALILVDGFRNCTGSLINTTANDLTPYFLTANHCLGGNDAEYNPNLNHWSFYWHYESPDCISTFDPPHISTSGANIIANNTISDFALLLLTEDPIINAAPYYLGWDRTGSAGTGGVGIHHPRGDVKKISTYTATPTTSTCANSNYWDISFVQTANGHSVMQPCSSGSSLINSNKRVIGQLYGPYWCPNIQCENPAAQIVAYGKFSVSWTGNGATDNRRRLSNWLDPNNTNATTLNGIDACPPVVNFTNKIVTTNTTVTSYGDINVQNVKVQNGAKLILDAVGEVNIISDFEVELGSEFEIK